MDAASPTSSSVSRASFARITLPWQSTLLFFCPEISSGISNTISINALDGSGCGPRNNTPDWLMFSVVPWYHVLMFLTRNRIGTFSFNLRARGTHDGLRLVFRRTVVVTSPSGSCTRAVRRMVFQSYLILCGTQQADLIVVAIRSTPRPRKFVRAPTQHENIQEFLRHGYVTPALPDAPIIGPVARLEQVTFVYCSLIRRM